MEMPDGWRKLRNHVLCAIEKMPMTFHDIPDQHLFALDLMKEMAEALEKIADEKNLDIKAIIKSYASQDYNYEHTPKEFIQSEIAYDCLKKLREWK